MIKDRDELVELMARAHHESYRLQMANNTPSVCINLWEEIGDHLQSYAVASMIYTLNALEAAGVVPVPVEATEEMRSAGRPAIPAKTIEDMNYRAGVCLRAGNSASPFRRKE